MRMTVFAAMRMDVVVAIRGTSPETEPIQDLVEHFHELTDISLET